MNYLIDTHLLLWAAGDTKRLSDTARRILEAETSTLWFSAAAIWEIAIKKSLGRGDFQVEPRRLRGGLLGNGWRELAISGEHALATLSLPRSHQDPFDRILVAQAECESLTLVTSDKTVASYAPGIILA